MLQTIIGALLPVVTTLMLGVLAGWRGDLDTRAALGLNRMVLDYALPMLLFAGTVTSSRSVLAAELPLAATLLAGLVIPALVGLLAALFVFRRDISAAALEGLCLGIPAAAFTGISILKPLIGDRIFAVVTWSSVIDNTIILPTALVLLSIAKERRSRSAGTTKVGRIIGEALLATAKKPVVIAPVLAVAMVGLDVKVPADLVSAFKLLGGTVGGVSLFASGIILQAQTITFSLPALVVAIGRIALIPALAYLVLTGLHVETKLREIAVLLLALPASPMQVILSVDYDTHQTENAALLLYSNVLCIPTLAFFIWLVGA